MIKDYVQISRLRFWLYLLGPFMVGVAAAPQGHITLTVCLLALYFTLPANLLIYGVNDIFDYDTDRHNPKKENYEVIVQPEHQHHLARIILLLNVLVLPLMLIMSRVACWSLLGFFFFGVFYSAPPVRAKIRPLLDSVFNILYVFPGLVGYGVLTHHLPSINIFIAASLWCMAMHAYSAVPDIVPDTKAGLQTIATKLGVSGTLWFCLSCYLIAALLSFSRLGIFSVLAGMVYVGLMLLSLSRSESEQIFSLYKRFPRINMLMGAVLFFYIFYVVR